jgi:anti-anti-sigma regulatory factor
MIDGPDAWFLYGEVDMAVERQFDAALKTVCGDERLLIDVAGLAFIDVRGIRALARAMSMVPLQLIGVRPFLRRLWKVGGFDEIAPLAEAANGSNPDLTLR